MGKIIGFQSEADARRVVKATKKSETANIIGTDGGRWDNSPNVIMAEITGDDGQDPPGAYAWTQKRPTPDDVETAGISGTLTQGFAIDPLEWEPQTDDLVTLLRCIMHDGDDFNPVWVIVSSDGGGKGTLKYQVLQMTTDHHRGWDWVRFH